MAVFDKRFKEIFSSQVVFVIIGLISGTILAAYTDKILLVPGMLILLPGFLEMRGNISGSLSARLTSGLLLGVVNPNKMKTKIVRGNLLASSVLVVIISLFLGALAFIFNYIILGVFTFEILVMPVIAGLIANLIEIPITLVFTFYFFKRGMDPSDIMGPFVASTGDLTSIISLLIVMVVL